MENTLKCEGNCLKHKGQIKRVQVFSPAGYDWGHFYYCEQAIETDKEGGFVIDLLKD